MKSSNVIIGKPKVGGSVFVADISVTPPTNATTVLSSDFKDLGYCSEDGIVNSGTRTVQNIKAWGGNIVASPQTEKVDTFKMTLIEGLNENVLRLVKGTANVSGNLSDGMTLKENAQELDNNVFVIDMIVNKNTAKRVVIPNGKVTEVGDVVYKDDNAVGYEVTITAFPDGDGQTHYEYLIQNANGTTYTYTAVTPSGDEDPSAEGWYVLSGDSYVLTSDTEVDTNKTYYERT